MWTHKRLYREPRRHNNFAVRDNFSLIWFSAIFCPFFSDILSPFQRYFVPFQRFFVPPYFRKAFICKGLRAVKNRISLISIYKAYITDMLSLDSTACRLYVEAKQSRSITAQFCSKMTQKGGACACKCNLIFYLSVYG